MADRSRKRVTDDGRRAPLEIVAATETRRRLRLLFQALDLEPEHSLSFSLHWRETPREGEIGPFRVQTARTRHAVPNDAFRLEHTGRVFAYSGDGRPTDDSEALFRDADLLFHECLTVEPDAAQTHHAHLGQLADFPARLGLGRARLYHVRMGERAALAAACAGLDRIGLAEAGERFSL